MAINIIKQYLPKRLFARTILIILLPIIVIEITIAIAFIQRHFEQVTTQMSYSIALEIKYIINVLNKLETIEIASEQAKKLGKEFNMEISVTAIPMRKLVQNLNAFDLSGKAFLKTIRSKIDGPIGFNLKGKDGTVGVKIPLSTGTLDFVISRDRISASNPHQLLVLMFSVTILLLFIAFFILKNQIKPITKLAEASEAFGRGVSIMYKPRGSEEVRKAGLSFLSMRSKIEKQIEQRTQMLSGVSHDLRTPLTRLKLTLSLMDQTKNVKQMIADIDSMKDMLDAFLTFSKSNHLEEPKLTNIQDLLINITNKNNALFKNVNFVQKNIHKETILLSLRSNLFERALNNLIDNSSRYAKNLQIILEVKTKYLLIFVEDDGPGIKPEERENALKPFTRLDNARNQNKHSGVGLGMSIARDFILSHGGSLSLETSPSLGGLSVKIILPR